MTGTILFIHGTGVRADAFQALFALVSKKVEQHLGGYELAACQWGDAFGARLNARGASIPGYLDTGAAVDALEAAELARWTLLATDPLLELRVNPFPAVLGPPQGPAVWAAVRQLDRHADVLALLKGWGLDGVWRGFVDALDADVAWRTAIETAPGNEAQLSGLVARAVTAALLQRLNADGPTGLTGRQRDALVRALVSALGDGGLGVGDWFLGKLANAVVARRDVLSDRSGPAIGDILRYQARGEALRNFIGERVRETGATIIFAHSLGGVAAVDWLASAARKVDVLVTVGSQAPYFYEIDALHSRAYGTGLPDFFPKRWLNFHDPRDLLGFRAEGVFERHAKDFAVDNGQPFPTSHSAYWQNDDEVWPAIADFLAR